MRKIAEAAGLSPTRVHQLTTGADLDAAATALGELRAAGWPAPEDPDGSDDEELAGRDHIADRLDDEVRWLRQCSDWLVHLQTRDFPPGTGGLRRAGVDGCDREAIPCQAHQGTE